MKWWEKPGAMPINKKPSQLLGGSITLAKKAPKKTKKAQKTAKTVIKPVEKWTPAYYDKIRTGLKRQGKSDAYIESIIQAYKKKH